PLEGAFSCPKIVFKAPSRGGPTVGWGLLTMHHAPCTNCPPSYPIFKEQEICLELLDKFPVL
ncbi:MAG: hypothetical protein LH606_11495, partial [Cytophagaceae bacterium]|nr:hypothetical protein [Cytophagaceae bacterium]